MTEKTEVLDIRLLDISHLNNIIGSLDNRRNDIVLCIDMQWDSSMVGTPYRANGAAFIYCTGGTMDISIGVRRFRLEKNCIMLYGPGNIIEIHGRSEDFTASFLIFSRNLLQGALLDLQAVMPIYQYLSEGTNNLLCLDDTEAELIRKFFVVIKDVAEKYSDAVIHSMLAAMFRTVSEIYAQRVSDVTVIRSRQEEYLERFLVAVAEHHKRERSVQFYADLLHITPKYLSTVIKEASGKSAAEWIDLFVIQEAKVLLRYSTKSIQEITYYLNFSTQSFFGKYFKRHTGVSPSTYRSQTKLEDVPMTA